MDGPIKEAVQWMNARKEAASEGHEPGLASGDLALEIWRRVLVGTGVDLEEFDEFGSIAVVRAADKLREGLSLDVVIKTVALDILLIGVRVGSTDG